MWTAMKIVFVSLLSGIVMVSFGQAQSRSQKEPDGFNSEQVQLKDDTWEVEQLGEFDNSQEKPGDFALKEEQHNGHEQHGGFSSEPRHYEDIIWESGQGAFDHTKRKLRDFASRDGQYTK